VGTDLNTPYSAKKSRRVTLTTIAAAIAICAIGAVTVVSRQKLSTHQKAKAAVASQNSAAQDTRLDNPTPPDGPSLEDKERLAAGLRGMIDQSTEGLVQVEHADGSVSLNLDEHFENVTVAKFNKNGSVSQSCVDNPQAAGAFFGIDPKLIERRPRVVTPRNQ
jgi:hypothetical protein